MDNNKLLKRKRDRLEIIKRHQKYEIQNNYKIDSININKNIN